jgi:hypothetical protein
MIVYKSVPDQLVTYSSKVNKIRSNIIKKDVWLYNNSNITKRKLNKVGIDTYNNSNITLYETPIFYGKVDEETMLWLLSFNLNDVVRIFISNNIEFDENCNIIHSKS